jgi:hypothetical protein
MHPETIPGYKWCCGREAAVWRIFVVAPCGIVCSRGGFDVRGHCHSGSWTDSAQNEAIILASAYSKTIENIWVWQDAIASQILLYDNEITGESERLQKRKICQSEQF